MLCVSMFKTFHLTIWHAFNQIPIFFIKKPTFLFSWNHFFKTSRSFYKIQIVKISSNNYKYTLKPSHFNIHNSHYISPNLHHFIKISSSSSPSSTSSSNSKIYICTSYIGIWTHLDALDEIWQILAKPLMFREVDTMTEVMYVYDIT